MFFCPRRSPHHGRAVGQNEVIAVLVPVVLVVVQGEARFFFYTKRRGQLQIPALILVAAGFADADQTAATVDKALDSGGNLRILPDLAAGMGGIAVAYVDKDINAVQYLRVTLMSSKLMNFTSNGAPDRASITPA